MIEYKKRWYLFLVCILISWLSLAIAFYTPMLLTLAIGFPVFNVALFVISLALFGVVAPLPIHLLNIRMAKKGTKTKELLVTSFVSAIVLLLIALLSFRILSPNIDWGSGQVPGLSFIVTAFVIVFWAVVIIVLIILQIIRIIKSSRKKSGMAVLLVLTLFLTACSANGSFSTGNNLTRSDVWNPMNFTQVGQSVSFAEDMPHGYFSVPLIRHMNDQLYERAAFTYRELEAAVWIVEELLAMGYTWDDIAIQEFSWSDLGLRSWLNFGAGIGSWIYAANEVILTGFFSNQVHRASMTSQNIVLTIPGISNETIIIGAHYDTVLFPGASDNASGTALLLESAQRMMYQDNYYTLVYIFTGAHEIGLIGTRYYVENMSPGEHENLLFMINADVLINSEFISYHAGFDDDGVPGENEITRQIDYIALELENLHEIEFMSNPWGIIFSLVDSIPFMDEGHTVVWLASENFPYMIGHTAMDSWEYINETRPGIIESNMRAHSIFLERLLMAQW